MNFLKKLFGSDAKTKEKKRYKIPENTKLTYLLDLCKQYHSPENYEAVLQEMEMGNSFLLLPSVNDTEGTNEWRTFEKGSTLKLTSVYNMEGLMVLGAFTDEKTLFNWNKKETEYKAMRSQDIIEFCRQQGIDRIVINSDQPNMFVLERNRENIKTTTIDKKTEVEVGTPSNPLSKEIIEKLVLNFKKADSIEEVYHYAQSVKNEFSLVLGFRLSVVSDNLMAAMYNAINNSLQGEKLGLPLDIFVLQTEDWLKTVRNINNSLIYKRKDI